MKLQSPDLMAAKSFAMRRDPLDALFKPRSVAIIGATEKPDSVGRTLTRNLIEGAAGRKIFPVNPSRSSVLGVPAFPSIARIPERVDLAVIATPAPMVPRVVSECSEAD